MRRILVVCYSRGGMTLDVASAIAERCGADLELIKDRTPRDGLLGWMRSALEALLRRRPWIQPPRRAPGDYALVIVGTPVWAGHMAGPVRSYLARQQGRLRRVAFFCTHAGYGAERVLADMEALCGRRARATLALAARSVAASAHEAELSRFMHKAGADRDAASTTAASFLPMAAE